MAMASNNYIYQTIHTLARHPLHVEAHCRILEQAFMEVFFRPLILDHERITQDIITLLNKNNCPTEVSVYVELRVDIDYHEEIIIDEISIYEGYSMRCISPSAECVTFDSPFGHYPTSARRKVLSFAQDMAINFGGEIAVECNSNGEVISGNGAAIFAITGRNIISPNSINSVERDLVRDVTQNCNLKLYTHHITKKDLDIFDELFIADHYGITSISRCAERYYIPAIAEKIVNFITQPWW